MQGARTRALTTQLYFPDLRRRNTRDFIYREELLLRLGWDGGLWDARFDFVLAPA